MIEFLRTELLGELTEEAIEYLLIFGGFFVLLWGVLRQVIRHRKIQAVRRAGPRQWFDEVVWSVIGTIGATTLGLSLVWTETVPPLVDLSDTPLLVGVAGLAVMLVVDDTWFYWLHRGLHANRWLYRNVHLIHHGSRDTTPLAGQRFHPVELFLIPIPGVVLPMLFLLDGAWYVVGFAIALLNNVYAHCGFELLPTFWEKIPLLRHKTTSLHHNMHHDRVRGNYALYFTWWDRAMGTEFADYGERRDELHARIRRGRRAVADAGVGEAPSTAPPTRVDA